MHGFPRGKTAIVGAPTAGVGRSRGSEAIELAAHASLRALADARLAPCDVDALFIAQPQDTLAGLTFSEYLGIRPKITDNTRSGGSAFLLKLEHAGLALEAGLCDVALIAYGSNQATASGALVQTSRSSTYEAPYRPLRPISSYALAAARHMHRYGTTKRQLAEVAVAARRWAQLNPEAVARDDLTLDAVVQARMVSDPLGTRDCCLVTAGAAAVVMVRADRAADHHARPVYLLGAAAAVAHADLPARPGPTATHPGPSGA